MNDNASTQNHPDLSDLDSVRTGEASQEVARHVAGCPDCQEKLRQLERAAPEFAQALQGPTLAVPSSVQDAIRLAARNAAQPKRAPRRAIPMGAWLAACAAAAVLLAVGLTAFKRSPSGPMDVDQDGAVDIVDAYLLSRRVQDGGALSNEFDFNGDGRVDGSDVRAIATQAVRLPGETS